MSALHGKLDREVLNAKRLALQNMQFYRRLLHDWHRPAQPRLESEIRNLQLGLPAG
ncbi:MAG: hypothetical protein HC904_17030 [Blastochloris sp.]|nr:hypothetical protein [Blastochloris sp.]